MKIETGRSKLTLSELKDLYIKSLYIRTSQRRMHVTHQFQKFEISVEDSTSDYEF